jgi:hypothetical protein
MQQLAKLCRAVLLPDLPITAAAGLSTNTSSNLGPQPGSNAAVAAEEAQISQPQLPGQQVAANGSCARLYQPCTCNAQ